MDTRQVDAGDSKNSSHQEAAQDRSDHCAASTYDAHKYRIKSPSENKKTLRTYLKQIVGIKASAQAGKKGAYCKCKHLVFEYIDATR